MILRQIVREAADALRVEVEEANQRLIDARAQLEEARINQKRSADNLKELAEWLQANP